MSEKPIDNSGEPSDRELRISQLLAEFLKQEDEGTAVSRDEFLSIPNKTTEGRPTQFFVNRQMDPEIKIWPVADNSTDVLVYDCLTRIDDADDYTNTMDVPFRFYPCLAAGLAYYLAIKKAPDRIQVLKAIYDEEFDRAQAEDRDRASFNVTPNLQFYRVI